MSQQLLNIFILVVDSEACTLRGLNLIEGYTKTVLGQDGQVRHHTHNNFIFYFLFFIFYFLFFIFYFLFFIFHF